MRRPEQPGAILLGEVDYGEVTGQVWAIAELKPSDDVVQVAALVTEFEPGQIRKQLSTVDDGARVFGKARQLHAPQSRF